MLDLNPIVPIITLKVTGLTLKLKGKYCTTSCKNQIPTICSLQNVYIKNRHKETESEKYRNYISCSSKH